MKLSVLIVDDERLSRSYINDLILELEPDMQFTIYEAHSAKVAQPILEECEIDILFLDIRMSGIDGFGLLNSLSKQDFELVFITAYSEYAIKAIKHGAIDYILKPIKKIEFRDTLRKVIERRQKTLDDKKQSIQETVLNDNYLNQKLVINDQQGMQFITLKDIVYLKADNTYTTLLLTNKEKITTSKPINRYEDKLDSRWFFRIHKSHIINMHHFKQYFSKDGGMALMDNGERLSISRHRLSHFLNLISNMSGEFKI